MSNKYPRPVLHRRDHEHGGADTVRITWDQTGEAGGGIAEVVPYSISGDLAVAPGGLRWYALNDGTIMDVFASVGTAPTGSGVTVQLNLNASSLGTVTIAAGANTNSFVPGSPDFTTGDYFTVDVTAIGSTTPGSDLVVEIRIA